MREVAKGFHRRRFCDLPDRDKRDILKLMARVAEQAYRRGVQQGARRRTGRQGILPRRSVGVALPSVARPVAVGRPSDDDHQPRSVQYRVRRRTDIGETLQKYACSPPNPVNATEPSR